MYTMLQCEAPTAPAISQLSVLMHLQTVKDMEQKGANKKASVSREEPHFAPPSNISTTYRRFPNCIFNMNEPHKNKTAPQFEPILCIPMSGLRHEHSCGMAQYKSND